MAEVTWYILDEWERLREFLRQDMRESYLIHLLTTYPPGVQKYGGGYFGNLDEIMSYFSLEYLEWGQLHRSDLAGGTRTFFIARI